VIAELREHLEAERRGMRTSSSSTSTAAAGTHGGSIGRMDRSRCVHGMIEAQVARTSDAVAVIDRGAHVTYRERRRTIDLILRPGDLIINSDAVLDRTLHIHERLAAPSTMAIDA
jgi:non-ribosomal peptide synthetase component F